MAHVRRGRSAVRVILAVVVLAGLASAPTRIAARPIGTPLYVALGDSIDFGFGDDFFLDGFGYVPLFAGFIASALSQPLDVQNLAEFGATTREILLTQLPVALGAIGQHQGDPVIVSWGGGGGDVGQLALSRQAAACRQTPSCLGRFAAALNEAEQAIDRTIHRLRLAAGPNARIFMRTQYNALLKPGCGTPDQIALGNATLEGAPGTVLDQGLNDRIRTIAARYNATVVDLFVPFAFGANSLISSDCTHPNALGYQVIASQFAAAF